MPTKTTTPTATAVPAVAKAPKATKTPRAPRKSAAPEPAEVKTGPGQSAPRISATQAREDLDIEHFRNLLRQEMARLEEERDYMRRTNSDMDGNLPEDAEGEEDTADLASSLMDKEMDLSVEEEIEDTMAAIEHAFQKMDDGTYGICDVSAKPIPKSRLELIPWASLTVECQALAEGE